MADGPRCKRRKQANPRRNNVTNYNNVLETNSDSDDEDKLHIVEDESVTDAGDDVPEDDLPTDHTVLQESSERESSGKSCWEDDEGTEGKEILGPEAELDEAGCIGTPDAFSQLLTCPYCDRGYKRFTSLKEHIKYRHEKNEDNFSCSMCSYTFAYRTQLERHMTSHKSGKDQRHVTQSGGNRKFKCTECGKAFKYKHHLKEHLRIHSGEKPYECSNCKKRFSHSGSYSSHISSKKCIGLLPVNGRARSGLKTSQCSSPSLSASPGSPARPPIRQKIENKPLQEQLPVNQIKTEPVDFEFKPIVVAPGINCSTSLQNGVFSSGTTLQTTSSPQGLVQAVVLPTMGLVSPISINLSDIQNVLKVAVDSNVIRQVLENNHAHLTSKEGTIGSASIQGGHSLISAISLPLIDQDGTTKIIINYSLEQPSAFQIIPQNLKKESCVPNICKSEKLPEDLTIKSEKYIKSEGGVKDSTCLVSDCLEGINALTELKPFDMKCSAKLPALGTDAKKSVSPTLSDAGENILAPSQPPLKNLLSLLKAYYALNAHPSAEELSKIADSVNLPLEVVKKWFEKMQAGDVSLQSSSPSLQLEKVTPVEEEPSISSEENKQPTVELDSENVLGVLSSQIVPEETLTQIGSRSNTPSTSPLNLSSLNSSPAGECTPTGVQEQQAEPLDLSLPKQHGDLSERSTVTSVYHSSAHTVQDEPLNLCCVKKEQTDSSVTDSNPVLIVNPPSANPISIALPTVTTQLPTLVAISSQNSVPCLRTLAANKQTILIPQLTYTYSTTSSVFPELSQKQVLPNGNQDERQDTSSEGVSNVEDPNDSDSTPPKKKMRKTENGMYACDLCDKIFQKSSSLLRHKYEHTGKRPHECGICNKAFKHKHHLIEHMRLHSGEKPYQCDKCGKRFSHSGSYSQHMNHRYSYCKKEAEERDGVEHEELGHESSNHEHVDSRASPSQIDSDERDSITRDFEEDSEKDEEDEKDVEEMEEVNDDGISHDVDESEDGDLTEKIEGTVRDESTVNEESLSLDEDIAENEENVEETVAQA
ncbi:zinc finger E-box-binding homeobox 1 isoform X2 [Lissotriton helveticus]